MRIASTQIGFELSGYRLHEERHTQRLEIREQRPAVGGLDAARCDRADVSGAGGAGDDEQGLDARLFMLKTLVERLLGATIRLVDLRTDAPDAPQVDGAAVPTGGGRPSGPPVQWRYDETHVVRDVQQTSFQARGSVTTEDGREIAFDVSLQLAYEHTATSEVHAGNIKDPLVLSRGGGAVSVGGQSFGFDLDADGTVDLVPQLAAGASFLAIDRNGNGRIDDGRELVGGTTGQGFGELRALDSDANGWIDENDAAFATLRLWTPGANGEGPLQTLLEGGVGALSTTSAATPFSFRDAGGDGVAELRRTGVFLGEEGGAGTVQQLDLYV